MPEQISKAHFVANGVATKDYRPTSVSSSSFYHPALERGTFCYYDVEAMRRDPQCNIGMRFLRAPIFRAEWDILCKNQRAALWADATIKRFWQRDLNKALKILEWGSAGGENVYRIDKDSGLVEYVELKDVHLFDMRPLQQSGKHVGLKLSTNKNHKLFAPRFAWWVNEQEYGILYGRPRLAGAFEPWMELRGKKGAIDVRRAWFFKNVFRSIVIRHPTGFVEIDGVRMSNQQYARQIAEEAETGAVFVMPSVFDEQGNPLWSMDDAKINGDGEFLLEYPKELNREILIGIGIPPEVIQAAETGGGWSGRSVPFLGYLTSEDNIVSCCLFGFKQHVLDHLMNVNWNIGPDDYQIIPKSLVPKDEEEQGQAGGQPGQGPPQQRPPQPTGGNPQAIMGAPNAGPVQIGAAHAPAGGVTIQGTEYTGGEFIPQEVMESATAEEKAQVETKDADTIAQETVKAHSGLLAKAGAAGKWMKDKTKQVYDKLEERYGRPAAISIFAAGHIVGLGTPLAVLPGSTLLGMVPFAAMAETYLQIKRGLKAIGLSQEEELSEEEIMRLGKELVKELVSAWEGYQEGVMLSQGQKKEGRWVTIGGQTEDDKKHVGGTPVMLDDDGNIVASRAPGLQGKHISEAGKHFGDKQAAEPPKEKPEKQAKIAKTPEQADVGRGAPSPKPLATASAEEIHRRIDRFANLFSSRGNHEAAGWMQKLKDHINAVGAEAALAGLGGDRGSGNAEDTLYEGKADDMSEFCENYLNRHGIIPIAGSDDPSKHLVSSQSPAFGTQARPDPYHSGDFTPVDPTFKNKLEEAKHLPGLESSEDISAITGKPVTHLTGDVVEAMDKRFGDGKWIIKAYGDDAFAGFGVYFPQRIEQIKQDARNTIWAAGENLSKYGFQLARNPDSGKVAGLVHKDGDTYQFATDKYHQTIQGDARHWADRAAAAAENENGPALFDREGKVSGKDFMAQPAFEAVGISDAERAAGVTGAEGGKGEGRTHIATRNGKAELVPYSTWIKGEHLPVVFENEQTRAMAKAALDAINALPESERQGQIYAPDIMPTKNGYSVVEANPANETGSSGYLGDNPFIIDSYVSHLIGRTPAHARFVRRILQTRKSS